MSKKWIYVAGVVGVAALFLNTRGETVSAQVRAALVQEVLTQGFQPFQLRCFQDDTDAVSTAVSCTTPVVPVGKRFVVEHISGQFVTGQNDVVDSIFAAVAFGSQQVYLPTQFESRPLNFGGNLGAGRMHQFGSPVKMYVGPNEALIVRGESNRSGRILGVAVGYLVNN